MPTSSANPDDDIPISDVLKGCSIFLQPQDYPDRTGDWDLIQKHGGRVVYDPSSLDVTHVIVHVPGFKPRGPCYQHTVSSSSQSPDNHDWGLDALLVRHTMNPEKRRTASQPVVVVERGWLRASLRSRALLVERAFGGYQVRGTTHGPSSTAPGTKSWIKRPFVQPRAPVTATTTVPQVQVPSASPPTAPRKHTVTADDIFGDYSMSDLFSSSSDSSAATTPVKSEGLPCTFHTGSPEQNQTDDKIAPSPIVTPSHPRTPSTPKIPVEENSISPAKERAPKLPVQPPLEVKDNVPPQIFCHSLQEPVKFYLAGALPSLSAIILIHGGQNVPKETAHVVVVPLDANVRATELAHRDLVQRKGIRPLAQVVSHDWLWHCIKEGAMLPTDEYLVKLAGGNEKRRCVGASPQASPSATRTPKRSRQTR